MQNYIWLRDKHIGRHAWVYMDHKKYYADQIFIQKKLPVRFRRDEITHENWGDFCLVYCTVPKKRSVDFVECMKELENKMVLMGETDYPRVVADWWAMLGGAKDEV